MEEVEEDEEEGEGEEEEELMDVAELREWFAALAQHQAQQLDPLNNDLNRLVRRGVPKHFRATVW